ncbi:MAG: hypothetical protein HYW86_05005 [Candidatus Roizmanbacteria bacterium]|nr:MAG: hypothetical protein HYW86_05005 [Candidatus Roizmanbacteria bacterium]
MTEIKPPIKAPEPPSGLVTPPRDPSMEPLLEKIGSFLKDERLVPQGSRDMLHGVAAGNVGVFTDIVDSRPVEKQPTVISQQLENAEKQYVEKNRVKMAGLEARYVDNRTEAGYIKKQIEAFAGKSGLKHENISELQGRFYDQETQKIIAESTQRHIDRLLNSEQGRLNPEKQRLVTEQSRRYLELISNAQAEGDLPKDLNAQAVLRLVEDNIWTLAYQDRVASENMLGDHGVRHIVGYNIRVCEEIDNELVRNGQKVRAVDRLIQHQVMINHDVGYATDPVRLAINRRSFGEDDGHNVLAAKYLREKTAFEGDPLTQIFSAKQLQTIHEGVLSHDSSEVNLHIGQTDEAALKENTLSAIHIADNTHVFEDKLPEILYTYPDTLRIMRLMKTAGEIGDADIFSSLQAQLVKGIQASSSLSNDDKEALIQASQSLTPVSYRFNVGRICGNKPEITIDTKGNVIITVQESAIHQEVVGLYNQDSYEQLRKFVADLIGKQKSEVDLDQGNIATADGKLQIITKIGENRAGEHELTDYQRRVDDLISNQFFRDFIIGDGEHKLGDSRLSNMQLYLEQELKITAGEGSKGYSKIAETIKAIKEIRRANLQLWRPK